MPRDFSVKNGSAPMYGIPREFVVAQRRIEEETARLLGEASEDLRRGFLEADAPGQNGRLGRRRGHGTSLQLKIAEPRKGHRDRRSARSRTWKPKYGHRIHALSKSAKDQIEYHSFV
jgi:hypothetical protein